MESLSDVHEWQQTHRSMGGRRAGGHPSSRTTFTGVHGLQWWLQWVTVMWRLLPGLLPVWPCRTKIPAL